MAGEDEGEGGGTVRDALNDALDQANPDQQSQGTTDEVAVPDTWSEDDKKVFNGITDQNTRKWLLDRDSGYTKKIGDYEGRYKDFDEVFKPHMDRISQAGQTPVQVIKNLLQAQTALETKPEEAFLWLAKTYNVDLKKLVGGGQQQQDQTANADAWMEDLEPGMKAFLLDLKKSVTGVTSFAETQQNEQKRQIVESVNKATTEFRESKDEKGALIYPYVSDKRVSDRMALLIKTGTVQIVGGDLKTAYKEAYDQSVFAFPDLRSKLVQQTPANKDRILNAKRAGVGVRGVGASQASSSAKGSLREQLNSTARDAGFLP